MSPAPELYGAARSLKGRRAHHDDDRRWSACRTSPKSELLILKRMREVTIGDHRSTAHGAGFDFVRLRDWQAGDRPSQIDWAQSTLTNFAPLIVRESEQPSTAASW